MSKESSRDFLKYIPTITDAERREAEAVGLGFFYISPCEEEDDFFTIANRAEAARNEEEDYFEWLEKTFGPSYLDKDLSHLDKKNNRFSHKQRRGTNNGKDRHTGMFEYINKKANKRYAGSDEMYKFRLKDSAKLGTVINDQNTGRTYDYFKTQASQAEAKKRRLAIEASLETRKYWAMVEQQNAPFLAEPVSSRDHEERPEWGKPYVVKEKETSLRQEINADMWRRTAAPRNRASNKIWA